MKYSEALEKIRVSGFHDNIGEYSGIVREYNITKADAERAWNFGRNNFKSGVPCACGRCLNEVTNAK